MMKSKYECRPADEDVDCYIKRNDMLLQIKDGFIDDLHGGSLKMLDFFYCNKSNKMVHIEYKHVLKELKKARVDNDSRRIKRKSRKRSSKSNLLKTIKDLQEKVVFVTEKLSNALKPQKSPSIGRKRILQTSESSQSEPIQSEQEILVEKHSLPKLSKNTQDNSDSMFSDSEEERKTLFLQNSNDTKLLHIKENCRLVSSESETDLDDKDASNNISRPKHKAGDINKFISHNVAINQKNIEECIHIDSDTLKIISIWASSNTDFFPYKGMKQVPDGTFDNDDEYFLMFLSMLNPTVQLVDNFVSEKKIDRAASSAVLDQDEFSKIFGLVRVASLKNTTSSGSDSQIHSGQRKPRLLRKRTNMTDNCDIAKRSLDKIKLSRPNNKNSFPVLNSSVDNFYGKSPKKLSPGMTKHMKKPDRVDLSSDLENVESVKFDRIENFKSRSGRVLLKRQPDLQFPKEKYSVTEDREIIKWVLQRDHAKKVSGNTIWIGLEERGVASGRTRSWQSLRNRFLKTILSQLRSYGLSHIEEMQLKTGALKGSIKSKKKPIYDPKYGSILNSKQKRSKLSNKRIQPVSSSSHKNNDIPKLNRNVSKYPLRAGASTEENKDPSDKFNSPKKIQCRKLYTNTSFVAISDMSTV